MKDSRRIWTFVVPTVGVLLFGYFVWPTPYEYTRKFPTIIRVNRFTGVEEYSSPTGWRVSGQPNEVDESKDATSDVQLVSSYFQSGDYDLKHGYAQVKNLSGKSLSQVRFEFSALDEDGVVVCTSHRWLAELRAGDTVLLEMFEKDFSGAVTLRFDKATTDSSPL